MNRKEQAINNFKKGYNCSQSIVLAFSDLVSINESDLLKLTSPFGGGMGRLRETCGAVSGCFIILGLLYGYDEPESGQLKAQLYERVQKIGLDFESNQGSLECRQLLNLKEKHSSSVPSERTKDFYDNRPCLRLVSYAAEILEEYINTH